MPKKSSKSEATGERAGALLRELLALVRRSAEGKTLQIVQRAELTLPQMISLNVINDEGTQTVSELAEQLHLTRGAVSRLVDQLVAQRLVNREESAVDRRQKRLSLTAAGRRLVSRMALAGTTDFNEALMSLDAALRAEFETVLQQVVVGLRARRKSRRCGHEKTAR